MRLVPLHEHKERKGEIQELWKAAGRSESLDDLLQSTRRHCFLIDQNGQAIGFATAFLEEECFPDEDFPERCLYITSFFIQPEWRHQHHGTEAFKLLRQWGRDNKAALIEIETDADDAAEFLVKQGLELVGRGAHALYRGFI